jgi:hypothetical protein
MLFKTYPNFNVCRNGKYIARSDENGIFEVSDGDFNLAYVGLMFEQVPEPAPEKIEEKITTLKTTKLNNKGGAKNAANRKRSNPNSPKTTRSRGKSGQH